MSAFYYESSNSQEAYRIDEISQQLLVYLSVNGSTSVNGISEGVDASPDELEQRFTHSLGPDTTDLIEVAPNTQTTIGDQEPIDSYRLTDRGANFVEDHKSILSMPADFTRLSDQVGKIRADLEDTTTSLHTLDTDELQEQLSEISSQLREIQEHIATYD